MQLKAILAVVAIHAACAGGGMGPIPANAQAETPPPYPEFTFRRITVPGPDHRGPRIDIQIAPRPDPDQTPEALTDEPVTPADPAGWFWAEISPAMPADPARFWAALTHLEDAAEGAGLPVPRLSTLAGIAETHGRDILMASIGTDVSPALALAVIAVESAGRADAVSPAGAEGLMQLIPATASRFDVTDAMDSAENIAGGMAYLDWLMSEFGGDPVLVLAAYNAGEGAVRTAGGVPDYPETRNYVPRVLAAWQVARNLCRSPPDLVSDGCVFELIAAN